MIKPFRIVWELIEFGLQALFVYVLAIILVIGILVIVIQGSKPWQPRIITYKNVEKITEQPEKVCTRISGCRIQKDGTIEF